MLQHHVDAWIGQTLQVHQVTTSRSSMDRTNTSGTPSYKISQEHVQKKHSSDTKLQHHVLAWIGQKLQRHQVIKSRGNMDRIKHSRNSKLQHHVVAWIGQILQVYQVTTSRGSMDRTNSPGTPLYIVRQKRGQNEHSRYTKLLHHVVAWIGQTLQGHQVTRSRSSMDRKITPGTPIYITQQHGKNKHSRYTNLQYHVVAWIGQTLQGHQCIT